MFLDVASFQGPGGNYPAPSLTVECTDTEVIVTSNGMPHYTYVSTTPNPLAAQNHRWTIPLNPEYSEETQEVPCLGTVGFSISGIPVYGPNEGPMPDPFGDPVANDVMDESQGHTGGDDDYHYHAFVEPSFRDTDGDGVPDLYDDEPMAVQEGPSPILGYALDGFPIYGNRGCLDANCEQVVAFKSSWESTNYENGTEGCENNRECNNPDEYVCANAVIAGQLTTACVFKDYAWDNHAYRAQEGDDWLDECNGRIGPDGTYRYHATTSFPYLVGCYHGVVTQQLAGGCGEGGGGAMGPGGMGPGEMMPPDGGGRQPPEEATAACAGSAEGDACSFMINGMAVNGTCRTPPGSADLACVPAMGTPGVSAPPVQDRRGSSRSI